MGYNDKTWFSKNRGPLPNPSIAPQTSFARGQTGTAGNGVLGALVNNERATRPAIKVPQKVTYALPQQQNDDESGRKKTNAYQRNGKSNNSKFNMHQPTIQSENHPDNLLKHEFRRGMIINAPYFEEDCNQVFGKPRFMIVVGFHQDHYVAVALYTREGKGLSDKQHSRQEFMAVRDGRIPKSQFTKQSQHEELVTDGTGARIHPLSAVWITRPIARSYDLGITCHGNLTKDSLNSLCLRVKAANEKMLGL